MQTECFIPTIFSKWMMKNNIVTFFINPTDAHNYKITGMLKQLKFPQSL